MKASDVSMALGDEDPVKKILDLTNAHQFERSILEHCGGNRLDKVVTALDSGTHQVVVDGVRDIVFFIVFELADGDLRKFVEVEYGKDLVWIASAIHSFCVAISQIHRVDVYHNDFKPGNALIFKDTEKVADFGRATSPNFPVAHDPSLCAGDLRFAPPEQLYACENPVTQLDKFIKAKAGDLYNLGSVMHFLITKRSITPEIISRLDMQFRPPQHIHGGWFDNLEQVLPYWRKSYDSVMTEFYDDLPGDWNVKYKFALEEIRDIIMHLCEPDFRLRGDLQGGEIMSAKYSLERIISRIDNLKLRVLVKSRA